MYLELFYLFKKTDENNQKIPAIEIPFDDWKVDNNVDKDCFVLTMNDYKLKGKEMIEKLGEFNYGALDDIPPNPYRIFIPLMKEPIDDDGIELCYQGEFDINT